VWRPPTSSQAPRARRVSTTTRPPAAVRSDGRPQQSNAGIKERDPFRLRTRGSALPGSIILTHRTYYKEGNGAIKGGATPGRNAHPTTHLQASSPASPRKKEPATSPPPSTRRRLSLLPTAAVECPGSTTGDASLSPARAPAASSVCGGSWGLSGLGGGFQTPLLHRIIQNPALEFFYLPFQNFLFW
jgi:hypothetical protein